ncbi:MAG: cache domain-containing protein [Thermodesulfobacteriota bacterium]
MKKILVLILLSFLVWGTGGIAFAGEFGTKEEAEALVKKAISMIKTEGKEKAFAEINNPKGKFVDRDLYIFVYDMNGKCVAHGFNPKMIGKDLLEMKDADGRYFVKERIEIAKTKGKGWQDYKFTNPLSKKIELKTAYIEKVDDLIVGCGVYKR